MKNRAFALPLSANLRRKPSAALWGWFVLGTFAGLVSVLLVFAPARWLAAWVYEGSGNRISLIGSKGTVWQGSAQLLVTGSAGSKDSALLPGLTSWRIRPSWQGLSIFINADCCALQAQKILLSPLGWSGIKLSFVDGQTTWPAALLAGFGTPWNTVKPNGQLMVLTQGLHIELAPNRESIQGKLQLDANNISSSLSTLQPIGSYRLTLQGGTKPTLQLSTLGGALQLSGEGFWVNQKLQFNGIASAVPDKLDALSNLLNIIGRRAGAQSIIKLG